MAIPFIEAFRNHPRIKSSGVDPAVFETAVDLMVLVLEKTPLNVPDFFNTAALKEAEKLKRRFESQFAQRGGSARKADALTRLIEDLVQIDPRMSFPKLLIELQKYADMRATIQEIADNEVSYDNGDGRLKTINQTALKDRLFRARKKYASR